MTNKRYTVNQSRALLARLAIVPELSDAKARSVLEDLLRARFGIIEIADMDRAVARAKDEEIRGFANGVHVYLLMAEQLRGHQWPDIALGPITFTPMSGRVVFRVSGAIGTMLTLQLLELLQLAGDRLHGCQCGRLYVRTRRQRYCSIRCQKRYYMRNQRAEAAAERNVVKGGRRVAKR